MSTLSNHWHVQQPILMDEGLLNIISAGCGQLIKILITLEPRGRFGSNFAYLFILTLFSHANFEEALLSIILAG